MFVLLHHIVVLFCFKDSDLFGLIPLNCASQFSMFFQSQQAASVALGCLSSTWSYGEVATCPRCNDTVTD